MMVSDQASATKFKISMIQAKLENRLQLPPKAYRICEMAKDKKIKGFSCLNQSFFSFLSGGFFPQFCDAQWGVSENKFRLNWQHVCRGPLKWQPAERTHIVTPSSNKSFWRQKVLQFFHLKKENLQQNIWLFFFLRSSILGKTFPIKKKTKETKRKEKKRFSSLNTPLTQLLEFISYLHFQH